MAAEVRDAMSSPPQAPAGRVPHRFASLGWGLACAACAGGVLSALFWLLNVQAETAYELRKRLPWAVLLLLTAGALGGSLGAALVSVRYPPTHPTPEALTRIGLVTGCLGGLVTFPAVLVCDGWLGPLASARLLWCIIGFVTGVQAHRLVVRLPPETANSPGRDHSAPPHKPAEGRGGWFPARLPLALMLLALALLFACLMSVEVRG